MGLFGKKIDEKKPSCCCCGTKEEAVNEKKCSCEGDSGICCIKVLGAGCPSCHKQYENAKEAVKNLGIDVEVEYVTDLKKIMEYGIMSMPAIVVNEKVEAYGKVLNEADVKKILDKYL